MRIWHLLSNFGPITIADDDRPLVQRTASGLRIEISARKTGCYQIELSESECRRIAEAIDHRC
jgi:hypothetical protein